MQNKKSDEYSSEVQHDLCSEIDQSVSRKYSLKSSEAIDFYEQEEEKIKKTKSVENTSYRNKIDKNYKNYKIKLLSLPAPLKNLSLLYKTILHVYKFNKRRKLNLIFSSYRNSLERIYKHRIEIEDLERLKFLTKDALEFKQVKIGNEKTFNIYVKKEVDIDEISLNFYNKKNNPDFDWEKVEIPRSHLYIKLDKIKNRIKEVNSIKTTGNEIKSTLINKKIQNDALSRYEEIVQRNKQQEKARKEEFCKNHGQTDVKRGAEEKYKQILLRVKEKENMRRAEFIEMEKIKFDYKGRIDELFKIIGKRAIKLNELAYKIGGINVEENILKNLGEKYIKRVINTEVYIVIKNGTK
ncbi:hypothetical protein NUSPORA_00846 [Nucleospora cyclopteri]